MQMTGKFSLHTTTIAFSTLEPADSERNDVLSNPPGAPVAFSSITGVELVAAAEEVEAGLGDQLKVAGRSGNGGMDGVGGICNSLLLLSSTMYKNT
ncbi:hypothetical protein ACFX15_036461 [Malus domestica]